MLLLVGRGERVHTVNRMPRWPQHILKRLGKGDEIADVTYGLADVFTLSPQAHLNIETDFGEIASLAFGQQSISGI
ncbi:MAG: hypothetical protein AAFO97_13560 [Pseudomonadota bacterium]